MPPPPAASGAATGPRELAADLPLPVGDALELVEELASSWGGELERSAAGGRLALPISAGLRHGLLEGEVSVSRLGAGGSRVELVVASERYRLHVSAVVVLLIGAAGGLFLMLAPLLIGRAAVGLLPAAFLLMLVAWFLVASRLRHRGAGEFLGALADLARREHEVSRNAS